MAASCCIQEASGADAGRVSIRSALYEARRSPFLTESFDIYSEGTGTGISRGKAEATTRDDAA